MDSLLDLKNDKFRDQIGKANKMNQDVLFISEAVFDSRTLRQLGEVNALQSKRFKTVQTIDINEYVVKLARRFTDDFDGEDSEEGIEQLEDVDWEKLGKTTAGYLRSVNIVGFKNGPISIEYKRKEQKSRRTRDKNEGPVVRPDEATSETKQERTQTDHRVHDLHLCLPLEPVNFWIFVLNPHSFTETVENIFDLSFLVKKGEAMINVVDGEPYIQKKCTPDNTDLDEGIESTQCINKFTPKMWLELCKFFSGREPFIPSRTRPIAPSFLSE